MGKVFSGVDLLITPTMPGPAETFALSKNFDNNGIRNTLPFSIFGLPTISLPCGFTGSGLPIGLQIAGATWAESNVLALARAYERKRSGIRGDQSWRRCRVPKTKNKYSSSLANRKGQRRTVGHEMMVALWR